MVGAGRRFSSIGSSPKRSESCHGAAGNLVSGDSVDGRARLAAVARIGRPGYFGRDADSRASSFLPSSLDSSIVARNPIAINPTAPAT